MISTGETTIIVAVVGIAMALIKLIEFLINKVVPDRTKVQLDEMQNIMSEIQTLCEKTHDIHNKTDEDGVPLCYFPRSYARTQEKLMKTQDKTMQILIQMQSDQKIISQTISSSAIILDRLEQRTKND